MHWRGRREALCVVGGNMKQGSCWGKLFTQNDRKSQPDLVPGMYPQRIEDRCSNLMHEFILAPFPRAKMWEQPKCPSTDQTDVIWLNHEMECRAVTLRNHVPTHARG